MALNDTLAIAFELMLVYACFVTFSNFYSNEENPEYLRVENYRYSIKMFEGYESKEEIKAILDNFIMKTLRNKRLALERLPVIFNEYCDVMKSVWTVIATQMDERTDPMLLNLLTNDYVRRCDPNYVPPDKHEIQIEY
jgi:hypothetical protein